MRAFVLTGGGSLGAWQVGQLQALLKAGITPDLLVGSSVGAMNAAAVAEEPSPAGVERLTEVWRRVVRDTVLPRWTWKRVGAFGRKALFPSMGIRRLIEDNLVARRFEDLAVPLHVVATSLETGAARTLSEGSLVEAILASTAIPGIYPPIKLDGERLVDGAISDNLPVGVAVGAGADEIYVLAASSRCPPPGRLEHLHDVLLYSVSVLLRPSTEQLAACFAPAAKVIVLPSTCPFPVGPFDFSRTEDLIAESSRQATAFLVAKTPAA